LIPRIASSRVARGRWHKGQGKTVDVPKEVSVILGKLAMTPGVNTENLVRWLKDRNNWQGCWSQWGFLAHEKVTEKVMENSRIVLPFKGRPEISESAKITDCLKDLVYWMNRQIHALLLRSAFVNSNWRRDRDFRYQDEHLKSVGRTEF